MRVLHLLSNWKWTGPAEPAVRLAARLATRHEVEFACGHCPHADLANQVREQAEAAGLPVLDGLSLNKHFDPLSGSRDVRRLRERMAERAYHVVHGHLLNDHLLAGLALRRVLPDRLLVRTVYGELDVRPSLRARYAFRHLTDGVIAASAAVAAMAQRAFAVPPERLFVVPGAVDVGRFAAARLQPLRAAARREFALADDHVLVGIVARVQRHRRFELLLEAFARAVHEVPRLRLVVVGRGTHLEEVAVRPAQRLAIADRVIFAGYRAGRDYDAVLAAMDIGLYLVPGSDGSCRAARELCAAGLPMLVTPRPPLAEIVDDGLTGRVVDETVDGLAAGLVELAGDDSRRAAMGVAARDRASHLFSLDGQADEVEEVYGRLLDLGPRSRR